MIECMFESKRSAAEVTAFLDEMVERLSPSRTPESAAMLEDIGAAARAENRAAATALVNIGRLFAYRLSRCSESEDWAIDTMEAQRFRQNATSAARIENPGLAHIQRGIPVLQEVYDIRSPPYSLTLRRKLLRLLEKRRNSAGRPLYRVTNSCGRCPPKTRDSTHHTWSTACIRARMYPYTKAVYSPPLSLGEATL